jgi:hypothetical protein
MGGELCGWEYAVSTTTVYGTTLDDWNTTHPPIGTIGVQGGEEGE